MQHYVEKATVETSNRRSYNPAPEPQYLASSYSSDDFAFESED